MTNVQAGGRNPLHEAIVRHVRDTITVVDPGGVVRFVNSTRTDADDGRPEGTGSDALSWVHPDDREIALERRRWLLGDAGRTTTTVLRVRGADGGWRHVETHGVNLVDDPEVGGLLYVTRDVEDRARTEMLLMHSLATQGVVAELGLRALRSTDVDEVVREALDRVATLLATPWVTLLLLDGEGGLRVRQQVGPAPLPRGTRWSTAPGSQAAATLADRHPTIAEDLDREDAFSPSPEQQQRGVRAEVDVPVEGADGPLGILSVAAAAPRAFGPGDVQFLQGVVNVLAGALERERRERAAVLRALHDPLTGLPSRQLFTDRLHHALSRAYRSDRPVAVLLVDLDRFKSVNDTWGHAAGDQVLRTIGPRLSACARVSDTVARYGGDEFVVLCEDDVNHVGVARVAASIRRACAEPVRLHSGESVLLSASIGIAWSAEEGLDADALLGAADAAMYLDKRHGLPL